MDISCLSEEQTFFREMFSALPLCKLNNAFNSRKMRCSLTSRMVSDSELDLYSVQLKKLTWWLTYVHRRDFTT